MCVLILPGAGMSHANLSVVPASSRSRKLAAGASGDDVKPEC